MPRSTAPTLLSLSQYAQIMRLDPLHFAQGTSTVRHLTGCDDVWYQYDWQDHDKVSRDQVAQVIQEAERDLADALGWWPAPRWIEDERIPYTHPQRTDIINVLGLGARSRFKTLQLKRGYIIAGGVRAEELIGTESFTPEDADSDGFDEWATFILLGVDEGLDACEVHAYFKEYDVADSENTRTEPASMGADDTWEVRPIYASVSGTTLTVRIHTWELFCPYLSEGLNIDHPIDADDPNSYVDELVFYRVYNDPSDQVTFGWSNEIDCDAPACCWSTQKGCIKVAERRNAHVIAEPGTYDVASDTYTAADWAENTEPDIVWINYYTGMMPEFRRGCNSLDDYWAKVIARLATSRFDAILCTCANVNKTVQYLQQDLALVNREQSFQNVPDVLANPFGSLLGEVEAWKKVRGAGRERRRGGTVKL